MIPAAAAGARPPAAAALVGARMRLAVTVIRLLTRTPAKARPAMDGVPLKVVMAGSHRHRRRLQTAAAGVETPPLDRAQTVAGAVLETMTLGAGSDACLSGA